MPNEKDALNKKLDEMFEALSNKVNATLNVLVIGKVSAGKSSFLNAFFDAEKDKPKFKVGAKSGETTEVQITNIGKNIKVVDTPGLSDINKSNSQETKNFIEEEGVDIGILVVSGSADTSQKEQYEYLKQHAEKVFVVLNKADTFSEDNLKIVLNQWKEQLGLSPDEKIYPVVSRGYDPKDKEVFRGQEYDIEVDEYGRPKLLKGIEEVRDDVLDFLKKNGKDLILAKELKDKRKQAIVTIATACVSAAGAAFVPGSALYIGAIQATAIATLSYIYTGEIIGKPQVVSIVGVFVAEDIGMELFLIAKSFLPPTGVLDVAAATIALTITAAMLTAVAKVYSMGYTLDNKQELLLIFEKLKKTIKGYMKNATKEDLLNLDFYKKIIFSLLSVK